MNSLVVLYFSQVVVLVDDIRDDCPTVGACHLVLGKPRLDAVSVKAMSVLGTTPCHVDVLVGLHGFHA